MDTNTLTVREPVASSEHPALASRALRAALAEKAVADSLDGTDGQQWVVKPYTYRGDLEQVEHERQSRLQRWQEQRGTHGN